jgi:predicted ATPase
MEANGGYTYKQVGNTFQVAFPTASQAAAAAAEAQTRLQVAGCGLREDDHQPSTINRQAVPGMRMALHTGVAGMREGGYVGPLLNRVARLLAAAHGRQVLLTQATEELLRDDLPQDITLRDLGEHRLKDLIRPERIYQLEYADMPEVFPPLKTLDNRPNNLPLQPTPLIGREAEVEAVKGELLRDDVYLLTLLGPGGIGKTRLALQAAAEMLEDFRDGVFFVNVAPISDASLVPQTIGQTLGVRESGALPGLKALKEYLRDKHLLLVLDNCEQVLGAGPGLAELLASAPGLKMLATSRAPFRLSAEHEYMVPALQVPAMDDGRWTIVRRRYSPEALLSYEAIELFVARARSVRADFELTEANQAAVTEICRRVDGLPLAIELAAARVRALPPEAILARLASAGSHQAGAGRLLTGGARDMPARQQTLRNTIQWSYDLLSADEQTLFNRLGVFIGGHTLEAVEAVCGMRNSAERNSPHSFDVLEGLSSLMDKSLIYEMWNAEFGMRNTPNENIPHSDEPRFLMLETLHEFALEQLSESGEEDAVRQAHADYFLQLAELAEPHFTATDQGEWLAKTDAEYDNVRAAVEHLYEQGEDEELGRLVGALWRFWFRRGHLTEGRRTLMLALEQEELLPEPVLAKVLHGAGVMAYEQGDYEEAKSLYERSLALRRKLGDKRGMIASLNNLANTALFQSDYDRAAATYEEAVVLARELQDTWAIAITIGNMGWVEMNKGDYGRAAELYEESLALRRLMEDDWGMANAMDNLAWARTYQGRFAEAAKLTTHSMEIVERIGDKDTISDLLDIQGRCALGQGDYFSARTLFLKSLALNQELEDKSGFALSLLGLAALAQAQEEWERAARLFGAADALRTSTAHFQRVYFRDHKAAVRERLGAPEFDRLHNEGLTMPSEQVVAYAAGEQ